MMTYYPHKISLSDGQKQRLAQAFTKRGAITLRLKNEAIGQGGDILHLTARQINKIQRAIKTKTGVDINMSKTQIGHAVKFVKAAAAAQGADMQVQTKRPPFKTRGKGMRVNPAYLRRPPPFIGSWDDQKKRPSFVDVPLTDFDLLRWCQYLKIPIKGIFSRDEIMVKKHSPCIINMDDLGGPGTHLVCCWQGGSGRYEYFDSFGLPPPAEWEIELILEGKRYFLRNDNQLQWESSVRCGYYCLLFLNERNKRRPFREILSMFSGNTQANEAVVKDYFSHKV